MKTPRKTAGLTALLFLLMLVSSSYPALAGESTPATDETARLVREADEAYQNGNFKLAIEKYQKAMQLIGEKKELAETKRELFQTMASLALTYFTIQENAKAEKQLQDLVLVNPNHELDPEYYPPKFLEIFRGVQKSFLGRLAVATDPAGAVVFLGATRLGPAPLAVEKVLKGRHELRAELAGYSPARREIIVQADADNVEELKLAALQPVVEKGQPPAPAGATKKKKRSPLLFIVAGAALAAVAVVLLAGKKATKKELVSMTFNEKNPVPIDPLLPSYVPVSVSGVPAKIEKIDFRVVIEHPNHMEDLNVTIVGPDTRTMYNIWNRGQSTVVPTVIAGSSNDFNNVPANGTWRLLVQNPGRSKGGRILEFTLKIYFYE